MQLLPLHPSSPQRLMWDVTLGGLLAYDAIMVPYPLKAGFSGSDAAFVAVCQVRFRHARGTCQNKTETPIVVVHFKQKQTY